MNNLKTTSTYLAPGVSIRTEFNYASLAGLTKNINPTESIIMIFAYGGY